MKITSHTILILAIVFFGTVPTHVNALTFSSFAEKVKAIFITNEDTDNEEDPITPQAMPLFKSIVVNPSEIQGSTLDEESTSEVLQATAGPLRVSTEDIDYPTTDTISVYEVKRGDTISEVASLFNVSKNTIMWANDLTSEKISPGDTLIILPITGIRHTIKKNDTITTIAKKYKADANDIAKFNGITTDTKLTIGEIILVPEGEMEIIPSARPRSTGVASGRPTTYANTTPAGFFIRPVAGGRKSQGIHGNNAVDIAGVRGTPILAAADGRVLIARGTGYNGGYGSMIVIVHEGGIQTLYAHMRAVYVSPGTTVTQGQVIGEMGNTGRSTGPHLHFEVRGAKNPF